MSSVTRSGSRGRVKVSDTVAARMSGDDRAAALNANIAAYDSVNEKAYVNGAPHLKHASIANIYKSIVDSALARVGRDPGTISVLELGAGNGLASIPWFERHVRVTAVDSSDSMLRGLSKRAAAYGLTPVTVAADAADFLNSTEETFDVITHVSMVHHVPDYQSLLGLAAARVSAGGCLITFQDPLRYNLMPPGHHLIEDHSRQAPNFGGSKLTGTQGAARRMDLRRAILERQRDWPTVAMIAVGLLAAVDRFYRLTGRSLWLDETVTAQSAHLNSAGDVIAQSQVYVNQAPLFYLITWLLRPWGDGEFVLRLPAAVAGTLTVVAVYLVGRRLFGARGALIAALLTAVMPYAVWYSQEARNYSLFMLFTTMQIYFAFNAVTRSRRLDWLGLALFTTLDLYTHYLAIAATAGVVVYVALFLGAETLRGTSNRTKAVTAAAVGAAALLAALLARRAVLKAIYLAAHSILSRAHMHRVDGLLAGLAISAAIIGFGAWLRKRLLLRLRPELVHKLEWAIVAALLVALAYAPWLPYLRLALSRPDVTVGLLHPTPQPRLNH